jgi:hypothetical protein
MLGRLVGLTRRSLNIRLGRHFQGEVVCLLFPGLKPWAVLWDHFHGQELPGSVNFLKPGNE